VLGKTSVQILPRLRYTSRSAAMALLESGGNSIAKCRHLAISASQSVGSWWTARSFAFLHRMRVSRTGMPSHPGSRPASVYGERTSALGMARASHREGLVADDQIDAATVASAAETTASSLSAVITAASTASASPTRAAVTHA